MKYLVKNNICAIVAAAMCCAWSPELQAQEGDAGQTVIRLNYHNENNRLQYLSLESLLKRKQTFTPQKNKSYQIYLDSASPSNKIADVVTNESGKAKAIFPPHLREAWEAAAQHSLIVKEGEEELISDMMITKAKIDIDTINEDGTRSILVKVYKKEENEWKPAADVELKAGVKRMGGLLSGGEEESYTTDSAGVALIAFNKDSLPGDQQGRITLMARIDENEELGNLTVEKTVPWGIAVNPRRDFFNERTLWSTRFNAPYWLLVMAYSIVIAVWGTLIYLIMQLIRIKKLGKT